MYEVNIIILYIFNVANKNSVTINDHTTNRRYMFATALEIEHSSHEIVQQLNTDRTDLSRDSTRVTHDLNMKENLAKKVSFKLH